MFKIVHTTDTHLNLCHTQKILQFCRHLVAAKPDAVVITGDIAEAPSVAHFLRIIQKGTEPATFPIFFVLGNHDFYLGSIKEVKESMENMFTYEHKGIKIPQIGKGDKNKRLAWLNSSGVIPLTKTTCLVGADGFYDGQYANWFTSKLDMNDYHVIKELSFPQVISRQERFDKINEVAKAEAAIVKTNIDLAFKEYGATKVFVATHVPPFKENSVYNGKVSDDTWLPHFSSKAMGDELLAAAIENPDKEIIVLCGHSHGFAEVRHLSNLTCFTGPATYRHPDIARIWETE